MLACTQFVPQPTSEDSYVPAADGTDYVDSYTGEVFPAADICSEWSNRTIAMQTTQLTAVQNLINSRLTAVTTAGGQMLATLLSNLQENTPDVYAVVVGDQGQNPSGSPFTVRQNRVATAAELHAAQGRFYGSHVVRQDMRSVMFVLQN